MSLNIGLYSLRSLFFYFVNLGLEFFRVCQVIIADHIEVLVEVVDEWDCCWDVQLSYFYIMRLFVPSSEIFESYFTMLLKEFPCATTSTFLPDLTVGTIVSFQNGMTRSIVVFRL